MKEPKILIAFYSRPGNNYVAGGIVNLRIGNTETAALMIKKSAGGDLFKIDTVRAYPVDYTETTEVAKKELRQNARPQLAAKLDNLADYDTVILGYPNWWGTMPMAVYTFLESYDFSDKSILPFCTHEGSGMGRSEFDIGKLCPHSRIAKGLAIRGSLVDSRREEIENWLRAGLDRTGPVQGRTQ